MATSQAPAPPVSSPSPTPSAKKRTGGGGGATTSPLPATQTQTPPVSMGVTAPSITSFSLTGANAFPCCGKTSVDIVEKQNDPSHPHQSAEVGAQSVEQKPLFQDPNPEQEENFGLKMNMDPIWKVDSLESCSDSSKPEYTIETFHPTAEELAEMQSFNQWSVDSMCSNPEEDQVLIQRRSIHAQTSRHLFWSDKNVQASENSLQKVIEIQDKGSSKKTTRSHPEKKSISIATPTLPAACSQKPPVSSSLPVSHLSPPIALSDLINFASSLAIASTSNMNLPSLEKMLKPVLQKAPEASTKPSQPAEEKQELTGKLKTVKFQKTWAKQETNFPHPFLEFSKPGMKTATLEGEVKFVQTSTMNSQESQDDSVPPGTKKGSPLLLKIHFKLLSPELQRND
ncbi:PREDICTED: spermatogenesis-associated protein 32 [Dipodomys ordii]|uniref:Spermatogenesis-associated protein 32 n=1 Tax=Dipodomys ordii TaxID=10020 RepID=A0A1S3GGM6_DIPOR|nr:PREDICTED: spermatogenesis-associated protein 32 [Dipodomys ordii]